ncbi:MAG: BatA domain-containing protein [Planctomycetota bacterium]
MFFFANPAFFAALGAAAVPILVHLFFKRRKRRIEFPSLRLISRVEARPSSRRRIREWLLLALRAGAVALAALACARPVAGAFAGIVGSASTDRVIVIDNSASMRRRGGSDAALSDAVRAAQAVARAAGRADRVALLWTASESGAPEVGSLKGASRGGGPAEVFEALGRAEASDGAGRTAAALQRAQELLSGSSAANREVFLFSDFQGRPDAEAFARLGRLAADGRTRVFFCEVVGAGRPKVNVSVAEVLPGAGIPVVGRPMSVLARVENRGRDERTTPVTLEAGGFAPQVRSLSVPPGGSANATFLVTPSAPGIFRIRARIEPDDLAFDDVRETAVHVRDRIPAGLLGGADDESTRHVRLALDPTGDGSLSGVHPAPAALSDLAGAGAPAAVFGPARIAADPATRAALSRFAEAGGVAWLWAAAGERLAAGELLPAAVAGRLEIPKEGFGLATERPDHPIVAGLADDSGRVDLLGIRVRAAARLDVAAGAEVLLSFPDRAPALVERTVGRGRILLAAFPPDRASSNLPTEKAGAFVALVQGALRLASPFSYSTLPCGGFVKLGAAGEKAAPPSLVSPDGRRFPAEREGATFRFSRTGRAGVWRIEGLPGARSTDIAFVVEPDRAEGSLDFAGPAAFASAFGPRGVAISAGADPLRASQDSRTGSDLFGAFLLAALLLYLLETALANELIRSRRRAGAPGEGAVKASEGRP